MASRPRYNWEKLLAPVCFMERREAKEREQEGRLLEEANKSLSLREKWLDALEGHL